MISDQLYSKRVTGQGSRITNYGLQTVSKIKKIRIDELIVERTLAPTLEKARALLMSGSVLVNDVPVNKAGDMVDASANIRIKGKEHSFVGRGGLKLAKAISEFKLDVKDKVCLDVGASTGGFTDCLLQNGAKKVYAVDVGYGQIAMKLASDERVVVLDRTNIRSMDEDLIPEPTDIGVVDVSFISLSVVLPAMNRFLGDDAVVVALIKPQFEVEKDDLERGGVVRDVSLHEGAITKVSDVGVKLGWDPAGVIDSPIEGAKGNKEFLIFFKKLCTS